MQDFMNGFIRALSMPNSAEHLYEAGVALDKWLGENTRRQELVDIMKANSGMEPGQERQEPFDYDRAVFGRQSGSDWRSGMPDGRSGLRGNGGYGNGAYGNGGYGNGGYGNGAYGRDSGVSPEGQKEIDTMMRQVEDQLIDILNRDNPAPGAKQSGTSGQVPYFMRDQRKRRTLPGGDLPYRDNP